MRKTLQLNKGWHFQKGISEVIQIIAEDEQLVDLPHTWNATDGQDGATIISVELAAMQKRFSDLNFLLGSDISWRSTEPILLPMCI